jgi:hypothetical protein
VGSVFCADGDKPHIPIVYRENPGRRSMGLRTAGTHFRILQSPALSIEGTIWNRQMTSAALETGDDQPPEVGEISLAAVANVARASLALRRWEAKNLPCNGSHLGFELFMMVVLEAATRDPQGIMLKHLYLSLPFSEKGLRLHVRRLEAEGWISIQQSSDDFRSARVEVSQRSWELVSEYTKIFLRRID